MRASAAINDHQGAFWGSHLNAGGVATITNCVSPGLASEPRVPQNWTCTRDVLTLIATIALAKPGHYRFWCADPFTFLLSSPFVHPLRRVPERSDNRMLNALLANGADGSRATHLRRG